MNPINIYNLLMTILEDSQGNVNDQADRVYELFIRELFEDEFGEMKFETIEGAGEYHANFDGHEGMGKTPALALKNLLQEVVNGLYFAENGRP
jgi:hypothetical protein